MKGSNYIYYILQRKKKAISQCFEQIRMSETSIQVLKYLSQLLLLQQLQDCYAHFRFYTNTCTNTRLSAHCTLLSVAAFTP